MVAKAGQTYSSMHRSSGTFKPSQNGGNAAWSDRPETARHAMLSRLSSWCARIDMSWTAVTDAIVVCEHAGKSSPIVLFRWRGEFRCEMSARYAADEIILVIDRMAVAARVSSPAGMGARESSWRV